VKFINGAPGERALIWNKEHKLGTSEIILYVVTPETFVRDWCTTVKVPGKKKKQVKLIERKGYNIPHIVILDEARRFRNPDSLGFECLSKFLQYYTPTYVIPMTGTPGKEPRHFWTMFNMVAPKIFGSYWNFVYRFHQIDDGFWGKEINEPKNLPQFHELLGKYFSVMKEDDPEVIATRQPVTRQLLSITMDDDQKKLYKEFTKDMMAWVEADNNLIMAQNELTVLTRLRQTLVCPRMLSPSLSVGAAIADFVDTVEPGTPYVIFTPYTAAMDHFEGYLRANGFDNVVQLRGAMGTPARDAAIAKYRETNGICICSTLYAQSFSLAPATKCFHIGYDWDPDNNRQAEARLQRGLVTLPISSYYYTFQSTFDENLCGIVNLKQQRYNVTVPNDLRRLLALAQDGSKES